MRAHGLVLGVALIGLAGCGSDDGDALRIYASGRPGAALRAQQLAVAEAGGRAGKFAIEIVSVDPTDAAPQLPDPGKLRRNAERAARDERAIAYLGEGSSGDTAITLPVLNRAGVAMVSAVASYTGLTREPGVSADEPRRYFPSGRRTFVRLIPSDGVQARAIAAYAQREGVSRLAVVHDGSLFCRGLIPLLRAQAERRGTGVLFTAELVKVTARERALAARAEGLFVCETRTTGGAIRTYADAVPQALLFLPDAARSAEAFRELGSAAGRARITAPLFDPDTAAARAFADRYRERYGEPPPDPIVYAEYEATRMVLRAIARAGERGDDRAAVVRELFRARESASAIGPYRIDRFGDVTTSAYGTFRVRKGELVPDRPLPIGD